MFISKYLPVTSLKHLGNCRRCMRISFGFALGSLATVVLAYLLLGSSVAVVGLGIVATGLNSLWIAHLIAFAWRHSILNDPDTLPANRFQRRRFVANFAKAFGVAALVTALPIKGAKAQNCIPPGGTCVLNGTPCCSGATCQGKFPNTTCQ